MTKPARPARGGELPRRLSSRSPKGEQLRTILEDLAASRTPGDPLPSERELAEHYDVARMTVRAVVTQLAAEGVVERVQGRGTFVGDGRVSQAAALSSFSEDMRARGLAAGARVLSQEVIEADEALAERLDVSTGTPVLRVHRLRTADGEPMAIEEAFLPTHRFPGVEDADLRDGSLFELLEERWGAALRVADQRIVATELGGEDADLLGVAPGCAGLLFRTVVRDDEGTPVAYAWSLFRGDRYEIQLRQEREPQRGARG